MATLYFEDISPDDVFHCGGRTVTEAEIIEFADKYDPQPFHVDREAAKDSLFGELVASGLHTLALCNRLVADSFYSDTAVVGGKGMDDFRCPAPVRPGDTISVCVRILETIPVDHDQDRGKVMIEQVVTNQDGEDVMSVTSLVYVRRDPDRE